MGGRVPAPLRTALRVLALAALVALFVAALDVLGAGASRLGAEAAGRLVRAAGNPFLGLFLGILATSVVQSSSATTSLVVALVAGGSLSVGGAIPLVLGANIGTTVTSTLVAMGHITHPEEFRRALSGATVHDLFNVAAVAVLLPLELLFGVLSRPAAFLADALGGAALPLRPVGSLASGLGGWVDRVLPGGGLVLLAVGTVALLLAIRLSVALLRGAVLGASGRLLDRHLFGRPLRAMALGLILTALVQSSSVTTSLVVPLLGAGLLTTRGVLPYTLGANIGTTLTALLAALLLAGQATTPAAVAFASAGLSVALVHVLFNTFGVALAYPVPAVREGLARAADAIGSLAYRHRGWALTYVAVLFYLLPLALEWLF